jgi:Zn-dependent protease with chaperone function
MERDASLGARILSAFHGSVPPIPVPIHYRLGLMLVAVAMVLLPLIYVWLIALVASLVVFYAFLLPEILGKVRGSIGLVITVGPLVIGAVVILFMIKPIFAPRVRQTPPRALNPDDEPLLFEFVGRLCRVVGAPVPKAILVDHQVNASASFRRGAVSLVAGDLQLCIGLPLVAGLTLRQFAGVLAHEFGHFSQSGGMRLTYVVRSINNWFARVVHERDAWDERLERRFGTSDGSIRVVLWLASATVRGTRRLLSGLMWAGHAVSCYMLRQMEFDADRYEATLAGSTTFVDTARRLPLLSESAGFAQQGLMQTWQSGHLADDFAAVVMDAFGRMPADLQHRITEQSAQRRTERFDTHPADADRIENATRLSCPGIFRPDETLPAVVLFRDFGDLSRSVSLDLYRQAFGPDVGSLNLVPLEHLSRRLDSERDAYAALARAFGGALSALRPLQLPAAMPAPPDDADAAAATYVASRARLLGGIPAYAEAFKRFDDLDTRCFLATQAEAQLALGLTIEPQDFGVPPDADGLAVEAMLAAFRREAEGLVPMLEPFEVEVAGRVVQALQLLGHPIVASRIAGAEGFAAQAPHLLRAAHVLGQATPRIIDLRDRFAAVSQLARRLEGHRDDQALLNDINLRVTGLSTRLRAIAALFGDEPYPLEHADARATVRGVLFPDGIDTADVGALFGACRELLSRFFPLSLRVTARLAAIAEHVDTALGLAAIPDPPSADGSPTVEGHALGA